MNSTGTPLSPAEISQKLEAEGRVVVRVKVIPKSSFNSVMGLLEDGTLKVRIAAVPEKGKANEELCSFLVEDFGAEHARIISGTTDPVKLVELTKE